MPRVTSGDGTGSLQSDLDQLTSAPLLGATGGGKHGRCATNVLRLAVGGGLFSCVAAVLMCTGLLWSVCGEVKRPGGVPVVPIPALATSRPVQLVQPYTPSAVTTLASE
jgi:hypothetical protein